MHASRAATGRETASRRARPSWLLVYNRICAIRPDSPWARSASVAGGEAKVVGCKVDVVYDNGPGIQFTGSPGLRSWWWSRSRSSSTRLDASESGELCYNRGAWMEKWRERYEWSKGIIKEASISLMLNFGWWDFVWWWGLSSTLRLQIWREVNWREGNWRRISSWFVLQWFARFIFVNRIRVLFGDKRWSETRFKHADSVFRSRPDAKLTFIFMFARILEIIMRFT